MFVTYTSRKPTFVTCREILNKEIISRLNKIYNAYGYYSVEFLLISFAGDRSSGCLHQT